MEGEDHSKHKRVFLKVLLINAVVFSAEFIVALYSGSLTMLSDSFHVFIHIIASLVGFVSEFEFLGLGPRKIKTCTALTNIALFFISAGIIAKEAIRRLAAPPELILNSPYFIIAFLGLIANIYNAHIIDKDEHRECSQNMKILHTCMVYDAVSSVIVIAGALAMYSLAMYFTGIFILDPVLSIVLVVLMLLRGWRMLRAALNSYFQ